MIGCCSCTKCACYQDKDEVAFYVGGGGGKRVANASMYKSTVNEDDGNEHDLDNREEQKVQSVLGDGKLIR